MKLESRSEIGIVTACHRDDLRNVKATIASARHFCPDNPFCLIADGEFDVSQIIDAYPEIHILRTTEIDDPFIRQYCIGNPRAKLAALWHGPFERFIYLDSDAIIWGDIMARLNWTDEDFLVFWPEATEDAHRSWMSEYYFDVDSLLRKDPDFSWRRHPYFSSGAFASRRHAITKAQWLVCEQWREENPHLFSWTRDQGILNYLVFSGSDRKHLKVGQRDLQWIPVHRGISESKHKLYTSLRSFPENVPVAWIVHFCGSKPDVHRMSSYSRPFTASKLQFYGTIHLHQFVIAFLKVVMDEKQTIVKRLKSLAARIVNKTFNKNAI
jgi:hypothetical protein